MSTQLSLRRFLLALAIVAVWGSNFAIIKIALQHFTPLWLASWRFALVLLPAVFFLPRPAVSWRNLATYGVLIGVGQFGLIYWAMQGHISPGLASLVVQTQVFFTILLAMRTTHERMQAYQWCGLLLAASGIVVIVLHTDGTTTPLGLAVVLLAALSWAGGNTASRQAGKVNMLAYVVWSSLFAVPLLMALAWAFEGSAALVNSLQTADLGSWVAVVWQAWGNSLFGYAMWAWLLARHPAATISPLALLVPVFGMGTSAWWLGEPLPAWKLIAAGLVMLGLVINLLWPRWRAPRAAAAS